MTVLIMKALKKLESNTKADPYFVEQLLLFYENIGENEKAMKLSCRYWNRHKNSSFFFHCIRIASKLKKWNSIISLSKEITDEKLLQNPYFWMLFAKAYQEKEDIKSAKKTFKAGLKRTGYSKELFLSYIKSLSIKPLT